MYAASILADSIGPHGKRLTSFEVTFPRMVLADMTRHRIFSYSFESTRAVPTEKRIEQVRTNPFIPEFRRRAKGMGGGEELSADEQQYEQAKWLKMALDTADVAESMLHLGKEHIGRMLEPYTWITGIVSGTEWENYFSLRCPPLGAEPDPVYPAQIELQTIAYMQEQLFRNNDPEQLYVGQWHLPLVTKAEKKHAREHGDWSRYYMPTLDVGASAGRCAAVSYLNHHKAGETLEQSYARWKDTLAPSAHWSPGEHPARCVELGAKDNTGNYEGWLQLRKSYYPGERVRAREQV